VRAFRPRIRTLGIICGSVLAIALLAAVAVSVALDVPYLGGRVNDLARMLSSAGRDRLEGKLGDLERRTGAQVVVLTIPSLEGESLEAYCVKVVQTWKLGRKGVDDGVLFLVAKQDRKMRIEVGYGLESRLTDLVSRRILDEVVRPRFRGNDFEGGIEAGIDAIATVVSGEPMPAPSPARPQSVMVSKLFAGGIFTVVIGVFSSIAVVTPGLAGWVWYVFLMLAYAAFLTALLPPYGGVVGCGAWIVGFPILRQWLQPVSKDFKQRHPLLTSFAGTSGHSGSGGGWSEGGFSGGGGSSGGGGASSSW